MMISKADFEELFPHLFKPEPAAVPRQMATPPRANCIARWEDDGGLNEPSARPRRAAGRRSQYVSDMPRLARAGAMAATMPAAAAYAAAWSMLSGYGR